MDFAKDDYLGRIKSLESEFFTLLVNDFIQTICSTLKSYRNNGLSLDNLVLVVKLYTDDSDARWDTLDIKIRYSKEYQNTLGYSYNSLDHFSSELFKDIYKETNDTRKSLIPLLNKMPVTKLQSKVTPTFYLNSPTLESDLENLLLNDEQRVVLHKEKLNLSLKENLNNNTKLTKV